MNLVLTQILIKLKETDKYIIRALKTDLLLIKQNIKFYCFPCLLTSRYQFV